MTEVESTELGGKELSIVPDGMDADDILGWVVHYTIGRGFAIDHDWLTEKADEYGLPARTMPSAPTRKRAFNRAAKERVPEVMNANSPDGVTFESVKLNNNMINLDVSDRRDDMMDLDGRTLARFVWDPEASPSTARVNLIDDDDLDSAEWYQQAVETFWNQFDLMNTANLSRDVSRAIRRWIKEQTSSVKMRDGGAVYFVPRGFGGVLDGFKQLARDIDEEWKEEDHECAVDTIEVIDSDGKREMVERKARKQIRSALTKTVDKALDQLDEDTAAEMAVAEATGDLVRAENVAVEHNALLDVEMSIKSVLSDWKDSATDERRAQIIDAAMDEVDV